MPEDKRQICPLCAWRANCVKRFTRGDDVTLHCPDFSEDVILRRQREREADNESENNSTPEESIDL